MTAFGTVYIPLRDTPATGLRVLRDPVDVIRADTVAEVGGALDRIMDGVRLGLRAAGWIAYEASPAMDSALITHPVCPVPRVWFGLYRREERVTIAELERRVLPFRMGPWNPSISEARYLNDLARIRRALAAGQTYQVNHTMRLHAAFDGDTVALFLALYRAQPSPNAMYVDAGNTVLASVSPELFLRRHGNCLTSRPMKGTAPRAGRAETDAKRARMLRASAKDRAENVMIVDMIRNDMGRISEAGSVRARRLFAVETYPTVLQMTSTVTSRTTADWPAVMRAMFPCASITGAPKVRTMRLIRELETTPRGAYTGCMGYITSPTAFRFNVAIRTVTVNRRRKTADYGVGGGIVWDSRGDREYRECLSKAAVLKGIGQ